MTGKKLMKSLGVDAAAQEAFEREKKAGCVRVGFNIVVTENWAYCDTGLTSVLLPLKEIKCFKKNYLPLRAYVSFYVILLFRSGERYALSCKFEEMDELAAIFTKHGAYPNEEL